MSNGFSWKAGALALAIVGGVAGYLNSSLAQSPVTVADSYTVEHAAQPVVHRAEVIVTEGRAS